MFTAWLLPLSKDTPCIGTLTLSLSLLNVTPSVRFLISSIHGRYPLHLYCSRLSCAKAVTILSSIGYYT